MPRRPTLHRGRKPSAATSAGIRLFCIPGLPEIHKGDVLPHQIVVAARHGKIAFEHGDILVVAQKIVSKSEGRIVQLAKIKPSPKARKLASSLKKDPRLIEVVLRESRRIVRSEHVLIVETHHGFVCANAGVDQSNVPGVDAVTLLPRDPDRSARRLAAALHKKTGKRLAIIVSDTFGRPWRLGLTNVAIGVAGVPALVDLRGSADRDKKPLHATILAVADELAAAAGLLMGKAKGTPVIIIRGYRFQLVQDSAARIIRPGHEDLFR
jgi:coenzyme F420-0:L-glutamate ligase / coenzyme F420-1:gamma-L-glutamate ligase